MTSPRSFSFEFFPPKTPEGADKLRLVRARLAALEPSYFSVTFGAGGSTREGTWNTVTEIAQRQPGRSRRISRASARPRRRWAI
jgi:methylenetetrahydrofolate reductase (NADPH)